MSNAIRSALIGSCLLAAVASCDTDNFEPGAALPRVPPVAFAGTGTDTLASGQDTYIRSASRNSNYGTHDTVRVRSVIGSNDTNRVVVSFTQSAIAGSLAGRTLSSATLIVRIKASSNVGSSGVNIDAHRVLKAWTQGGTTWNCAQDSNVGNSTPDCSSTSWQMSGASQNAFSSTRTAQVHIVNAQTGTISFNVTADVNAFLAGTSNFGWLLKTSTEAQAARVVLHAKESSNVSARPRLVLLSSAGTGAQPPGTTPPWFVDDTSYASAGFLKGVVGVVFRESATQSQRQTAVTQVNGTVIGGSRYSSGDGVYFLAIGDNGSGAQLAAAESSLMANPQVEAAFLNYRAVAGYRRPIDGTFYGKSSWQLSPDSGSGANWALEAIDAPYGWGCSIGDTSVNVAVIDHVFDSTDVVKNARSPLPSLGGFSNEARRHGTYTSNIVAARGDDSVGMTGVMWKAGVQLVEVGSANGNFATLGSLVEKAAQAGAQIVNLSWNLDWLSYVPVPADTMTTSRAVRAFMPALRRLNQVGKLPLLVLIAGNNALDAKWAGLPMLRDSFPNNVLVVGASDSARAAAQFSNTGNLVDIYAPGESVGAIDKSGLPVRVSGTSYSAPYVAGVAGLLKSFDPRLAPSDLRRLILEGADSGNRTVGATGKKLLNAYQSLRAAARRPGAPLCGNRLWVQGDNLMADRGTFDDILFAGVGGNRLNWAYHGGHIVLVGGGPFREWRNGVWGDISQEGFESTAYLWLGSGRSALGESHDGDTTVFARQVTYQPDPRTEIVLRLRNAPFTELAVLTSFSGLGSAFFSPTGKVVIASIAHYELVGDGQIYRGTDVYAVAIPSGAKRLLYSLPSSLAGIRATISEDGSEFAAEYGNSDPASPSCMTDFRSMADGRILRNSISYPVPTVGGCGGSSMSAVVARLPAGDAH